LKLCLIDFVLGFLETGGEYSSSLGTSMETKIMLACDRLYFGIKGIHCFGVLKIFFKKIIFKLIYIYIYIYIILLYFQTPTGPNAVDFEHLAINFLLAMIRE
jgi:hypothetical protein